jgi:predicted DsbA family dithiol-disulfide isomerase
MKRLTAASPLIAAAMAAVVACSSGSTPGDSSPTAAQVGARRITLAEVDAVADPARTEIERYKARRIALDQLIEDALLDEKARSLGISKDELLKREVDDKVPAPSEDVVRQSYERWTTRGPYEEEEEHLGARADEAEVHGSSEAAVEPPSEREQSEPTFEELAPKIREMLTWPQRAKRRTDFLASLRGEAVVEVDLPMPRTEVATTGGYERGPKDAPVTLVEFSNFQCPYCSRARETVEEMLARYDGKIRYVFMDFPQTVYPMAYPAAVAARCASEQGRFREYQDVLFERQKDLSPDRFEEWAGELGLDRDEFGRCLESKRYDAAIRQSIETGRKAGVNVAPRLFINGVPFTGAESAEALQKIIDDELSRKS